MSCPHGNHIDACDICDEVAAAYNSGVEHTKREWVGLTDDELLKTYGWYGCQFESYGQSDRPSSFLGQSILDEAKQQIIDGLRKVEAKLKEKNDL